MEEVSATPVGIDPDDKLRDDINCIKAKKVRMKILAQRQMQ